LPPEPAAPVSPAWATVHDTGTRIARTTKHARINLIVVSLCRVGERLRKESSTAQDSARRPKRWRPSENRPNTPFRPLAVSVSVRAHPEMLERLQAACPPQTCPRSEAAQLMAARSGRRRCTSCR
jgi:hypothetical protein